MDKKVVIGLISLGVLAIGGTAIYMVMDKKKKAAASAATLASLKSQGVALSVSPEKLDKLSSLATWFLGGRVLTDAEKKSGFTVQKSALAAALYQMEQDGELTPQESNELRKAYNADNSIIDFKYGQW